MKSLMLVLAFAVATAANAQATSPVQDTSPQNAGNPRGGYEPITPLFSTPPQPGQPVVFVPNPLTPAEAYPAPPPLPYYPLCKPGQFDKCRQRGG